MRGSSSAAPPATTSARGSSGPSSPRPWSSARCASRSGWCSSRASARAWRPAADDRFRIARRCQVRGSWCWAAAEGAGNAGCIDKPSAGDPAPRGACLARRKFGIDHLAPVGLLDYYRQFEGLSEDEVNAELRRNAAEQRQRALARVDPIDLSQTTWPELPPHTVVNAVTYIARRGLHRYLDPHAGELRGELAALHGIAAEQVVVGNGAAQLLAATAHALMEPGDELVTPWPSYPLYPVMARRARGRAV